MIDSDDDFSRHYCQDTACEPHDHGNATGSACDLLAESCMAFMERHPHPINGSIDRPYYMLIDRRDPRAGDEIYLPSALYLGHGRDDRIGGLAEVDEVTTGMSAGQPALFVRCKEHPTCRYNWAGLKPVQKELRERFGDQRSHPDPDMRPEFNEP